MAYGIQGPAFWDDEKLTKCGPWARLLASFLITGRQATLLPGLIPLGMAALAEGASIPLSEIEGAFAELQAIGFAEYDATKRLVRVPRGPRYNPPRNGHVVQGWFRHWRGMPESPLKYRHLESIREGLGAAALDADKTWPMEAWARTFGTVAAATVATRDSADLTQTAFKPDSNAIQTPFECHSNVSVLSYSSPDPDPEGDGHGNNTTPTLPAIVAPAPADTTGPVERRRQPRGNSVLAKHRAAAERLWQRQNELRREAIPGSRMLAATDADLARIAERLEEGRSEDDCDHVLRVYASEARRNPGNAKWFNGQTNWRPENFARALGSSLGQGDDDSNPWLSKLGARRG